LTGEIERKGNVAMDKFRKYDPAQQRGSIEAIVNERDCVGKEGKHEVGRQFP
jgi:hypothetical protein